MLPFGYASQLFLPRLPARANTTHNHISPCGQPAYFMQSFKRAFTRKRTWLICFSLYT